jgi:hypothetical protein
MEAGKDLLAVLLAASGCTTYEYDEEVFLEVDGSGEIRMSGSTAAIEALHGLDEASAGSAKALFEGEGVEILSALETERDRRKFVHVQARFADWEKLCRIPGFHNRRCRLAEEEEGLALELSLPSPQAAAPEGLDPQALLALRYHLPSTIRYHNSPSDIERGNILSWKRTLKEHFAGRPLDVEVRFDRRTILAATVSIVGLALGLVLASIVTALFVMVRKGRRQLRAEAISGCPSRSDHPSGG